MARLSREFAVAAARLATASGVVGLLDRLGAGAPSQVHVLMYHRVARHDDDPSLCAELVSATPEAFAAQMEWLRERRTVVSMDDLVDAACGLRPLPPRAVAITFDDAYADFADNAWPVLERLDLPAAMFVPTAFPGDGGAEFWWDRLHRAVHSVVDPAALLRIAGLPDGHGASRLAIYRRLRDRTKALPHGKAMALVDELCLQAATPARIRSVLDWDELRTLARRGLRLCPHTRTHPMLDRVRQDELRAELAGSLSDLVDEIGETPPVFAYPSGAYNRSALRVAQELGIRVAFTTRRGVADLEHHHPLELPRIPVSRGVTLPVFRAQLLAQFAHLNGLWT